MLTQKDKNVIANALRDMLDGSYAPEEKGEFSRLIAKLESGGGDVPDGLMLVHQEWLPIMEEVDRRAEKMDGRNDDFTVNVYADQYRDLDNAERGNK